MGAMARSTPLHPEDSQDTDDEFEIPGLDGPGKKGRGGPPGGPPGVIAGGPKREGAAAVEATRPAAHSEVTDALVTAEGPVDPGALVPVDPAAEDSKFAVLAARNIQTYESMIKTCEELGDPLAQSYMEIRRLESRKRLRRVNPAVRKDVQDKLEEDKRAM